MTEKKNGFIGLFSSDKLMFWAMLIAAVFSFVQAGMNAKIISYFNAFTFAVNAVCVVILYISYKKHDKNVMKGIMGAVFMLMLLRNADTSFSYIQNIEKPSMPSLVVLVITFLLILILMINHFIINSDRHSRPWNVKFNQIVFLVLLAVQVVLRMYMIIISNTLFLRLSYFVSIFTMVSSICLLICIETKLEGYKALREANGWVEKPYSSDDNAPTE